MYKSIYVPVDNSDHSNRAVACAMGLGKAYSSKLVGCHVYAAKLHDYRFRQMEYTLPEEYIDEVELERQRKIHDSLITMGLKLISDSYLDGMSRLCAESGLAFEPRMMDGKHHAEILKDLAGSPHDLVVIGALGIGRARDSVIGSVCERVARQSDRDVWVVKHVPEPGEAERDTILVGVDGSPQSFGSLMTAIDLARTFGKKVEAIAVYDPYLHYSVFNGIVNVLTEQAAKVFRFEEQNQLHEEIIDTGLAQIYQSHLEIGERMGNEAGVEIKKTLLDGKPFQKILDHARKTNPWLIVMGRIGVHSPKDETGLGSNAENVLRGAPCDVLLSTRVEVPRLDVRAEETVRWTPEAEARMTHVPEQVKGIARTGVLRLALEKGHSVITSAVIDEAMDRFMPKSASAATKALAEAVALERAKSGPVSMCRACGVAATQSGAVKCTVCGGTDFDVISQEMIEKIAAVEGGLEEETTYDGRKLRWSEDARKGLWSMKNAYQRRRVKARVEKRARMMKLDAITLVFARGVIEEETGTPLDININPGGFAPPDPPSPSLAGTPSPRSAPAGTPDGVKLIARDDKKNPLISTFEWTADAAQRIMRVPAGFMRNKTQERIEELARERTATTIDLALVEDGIEMGKKMMAEMIATYEGPKSIPAKHNLNEVSPITAPGTDA
ncbi:MAG TPA: universal stress protein [Vicinamibacterales bacterium]|nr:universal stress protein [Vicinamibacterales bacterium]